MNADQMIQQPVPRVLQYGVIQLMLFVMGITLAIGVVRETEFIPQLADFCDKNINNIWIMGVFAGLTSCVLDTFATCMSFISLYNIVDVEQTVVSMSDAFISTMGQNGLYWKIIAYCSAMGGNVMLIGSISGLALMKMERIHIGWYIKNVGLFAFLGWLGGLAFMWVMNKLLIVF